MSRFIKTQNINGYPLAMLTSDEKEVLYRMFNIKAGPSSNEELVKKMGKLLLPVGGFLQKELSYEETLLRIANNRKINLKTAVTVYEKEQKLFLEIFQDNFNEMNADEKEQFLINLEKKGLSKDQVASVAALTTLGVAQLSGFGIYLLASSTVGAITAALGFTLSFGFYTAMSSIISVAIGPIGFALAAIPLYRSFKDFRNIDDFKNKLSTLYKKSRNLIKGDHQAAEIIMKYFAGLRIMKIHELEVKIKENQKLFKEKEPALKKYDEEREAITESLAQLDKRIDVLEEQLKKMRKEQSQLSIQEFDNAKARTELNLQKTMIGVILKTSEEEIKKLKT